MLRAALAEARSGQPGDSGGYTRSSVMKQHPLACPDQGLVSERTGWTYQGGWPLRGTHWRSES